MGSMIIKFYKVLEPVQSILNETFCKSMTTKDLQRHFNQRNNLLPSFKLDDLDSCKKKFKRNEQVSNKGLPYGLGY